MKVADRPTKAPTLVACSRKGRHCTCSQAVRVLAHFSQVPYYCSIESSRRGWLFSWTCRGGQSRSYAYRGPPTLSIGPFWPTGLRSRYWAAGDEVLGIESDPPLY